MNPRTNEGERVCNEVVSGLGSKKETDEGRGPSGKWGPEEGKEGEGAQRSTRASIKAASSCCHTYRANR